MKTTTPQITVRVDGSKMKKNGEMPLYIHCNWHGRAKVATGIYVRDNEFNESKLQVKNSVEKSEKIRHMVTMVERRIASLQESGKEYTAKECLSSEPSKKNTLSFTAVFSEMAERRGLAHNSTKKYLTSYNMFKAVTDMNFNELSVDDWMGIAKTWQRDGKHLTTIWGALSCFKSLLNYCLEEGYVKDNPLNRWNYRKHGYKPQNNPRALNYSDIEKIEKWVEETDNFSGKMWLGSFYFCGLAGCDLLLMDWNKVEDKGTYYTATTHRKKTNKQAVIVAEHNEKTEKILGFLQDNNSLFKSKTTQYWSDKINKGLKDSPIKNLTFYVARHSYCTSLVNSNRVALSDIATLMGRDVEGLSVYIKQLNRPEDIARRLGIDYNKRIN